MELAACEFAVTRSGLPSPLTSAVAMLGSKRTLTHAEQDGESISGFVGGRDVQFPVEPEHEHGKRKAAKPSSRWKHPPGPDLRKASL